MFGGFFYSLNASSMGEAAASRTHIRGSSVLGPLTRYDVGHSLANIRGMICNSL